MSSAKITLFSFARWMRENNNDLFSALSVPSGIDKDVLVDNILLRGGEFEVVYSDPNFMQYAIGSWSRKWYRTMQKWIEALSIDYNPLENYDRYEDIRDKSERINKMDRTLDHQDQTLINTQDLNTINTENKQTLNTQNKRTLNTDSLNTRNLKDEETRDLEDKETPNTTDTTTFDHTVTQENLVSSFDSSTYQPKSQTITTDGIESGGNLTHNTQKLARTGTDTFKHTGKDIFDHTGYDDTKQTGTDTMDNSGTDTMNNTGTERLNRTGTETTGHTGTIKDNGTDNGYNEHLAHIHGNIGTMTSQSMLESELNIDAWNIYEHITDLFLTEFVIPIYT